MIILLGTHPQYGHSPPTRADSKPTTPRPASARRPATNSPPTPSPTTITSASVVIIALSLRPLNDCLDTFASPPATFLPPAHRAASWRPRSGPEPARPCRRSRSPFPGPVIAPVPLAVQEVRTPPRGDAHRVRGLVTDLWS